MPRCPEHPQRLPLLHHPVSLPCATEHLPPTRKIQALREEAGHLALRRGGRRHLPERGVADLLAAPVAELLERRI
jgi:hypothetical protein